METPQPLVQWLNSTYPKPRVDPEWLDACYDYIMSSEPTLRPTTDLEKIIHNVEIQLLGSNLSDSMLPGTGLPPNISTLDNVRLPAREPILVEIVSITDVGNSAFSLLNTRQTRLDRADLAGLGEDAENAEDDEGPVPKYPRSMLRFELSDGSTTLRAMEYRRLPELELGATPLGYKMLLKGVFIRRGIAFLEPKCVVMKGNQTEDREAVQDAEFLAGLRLRLGQDPDPDAENEPRAPAPNAVAAEPRLPQPRIQSPVPAPPARSPFRELSDPPEPPTAGPSRTYHDDEGQPRRRKIPNRHPSPPVVNSSYFSAPSVPSELARTRLFSPRCAADVPEVTTCTSAPSSDFGDESMEIDDAMLERITQLEQAAVSASQDASGGSDTRARSTLPPAGTSSSSASGSGTATASATLSVSTVSAGSGSGAVPGEMEVITIDDDEEDDKENVPVPTRHVRRRTAPRLTIIGDVIDISD